MSRAPIRLVQFTDLHLYGAADGACAASPTLPTLEAALAAARARAGAVGGAAADRRSRARRSGGYAHVRRLFGDLAGAGLLHSRQPRRRRCRCARALAGAPFQICGTARHGEWLLVMLDSYVSTARRPAGSAAAELARLDAALAAHRRPARARLPAPPPGRARQPLARLGGARERRGAVRGARPPPAACARCSGATSTRPSTASVAACGCWRRRRPACSSSPAIRRLRRRRAPAGAIAGSSCTPTAGVESGVEWVAVATEDRAGDTRRPPARAASISKSSLLAPQSGQLQSAGTSLQRVPGAIPRLGSPSASS